MGYGFQPAETVPLIYISYQAVFPTPPYPSFRQWARLNSRVWFPVLFRGSILSCAIRLRSNNVPFTHDRPSHGSSTE